MNMFKKMVKKVREKVYSQMPQQSLLSSVAAEEVMGKKKELKDKLKTRKRIIG
jgi:hypothetical protein